MQTAAEASVEGCLSKYKQPSQKLAIIIPFRPSRYRARQYWLPALRKRWSLDFLFCLHKSFKHAAVLFIHYLLPVCNVLLGLGGQTSLGAAEGSRRTVGSFLCPDNEIRLQLPPSLRSSLTYLSCTDAPCPEGGILNRVPLHRPTWALICDPKW